MIGSVGGEVRGCGEVVEGVEVDHVGDVGGGSVVFGIGEDLGVEFGSGDGGEVGRIGLRDGDAVSGIEEWHDWVETFGGELVVAEGAK